jgi:malate dehydrogenase (oxaloacetate-decarboxylating)(NADP+)
MYVFPGIGLGAILCKAVNITQDMIYASGEYLSRALNEQEAAAGYLYPEISRIREVSVVVTRGVIRTAQQNGVDRELSMRALTDEELDRYIEARMYDPFKETENIEREIKEHGFRRLESEPNLNGVQAQETPRNSAGAHL